MNGIFIILFMLFMHVFDDYVLQGCLANLKQKSFWGKNAPQEKYRHDYIAALFAHSLSWSFCIMLPVAILFGFNVGVMFLVMFIVNMIIHAMVDNLKANALKINLIVDQMIHVGQILVTYFVLTSL